MKKCTACKGKGWLVDGCEEIGFEVQRCDACKRFKNDLKAAMQFFKSPTGQRYHLERIVISKKPGAS